MPYICEYPEHPPTIWFTGS